MDSTQKYWWERDSWSKVIVSVVIPIIIGIVASVWGYFISSALKDKELKVKYVEIAVSILRDNPSKDTIPIRDWAVDVFEECSEVKLSKEAKDHLKSHSLRIISLGGAVIGGESKTSSPQAELGGDHQKVDK